MTTKKYEDAEADWASPFTKRGKDTGTTRQRRLHIITRSNMHTGWRHSGRVTRLVAGAVALAVASLGFTSAAGAVGTTPRLEKPSGIEGASPSLYLAGFRATPNGGLASASVTFTVPAISCTATDKADGADVETGVYTDTFDVFALVDAVCKSSGPAYSYFLQTGSGSFNPVGAAAGDVVVASLFESGTSTWAEIHDLTNGQYWYDENSANQGDTVVDIGTDSFAYVGTPVPTFTKVKFTNASVNGDYLGFDSRTEYNTLNGGDLLIKAGALTTSATGSSFSDTFKHAS